MKKLAVLLVASFIAKGAIAQAVRKKLSNLGFELMPQMPPAEFGKLIQRDLVKWVPIVKASGATVD